MKAEEDSESRRAQFMCPEASIDTQFVCTFFSDKFLENRYKVGASSVVCPQCPTQKTSHGSIARHKPFLSLYLPPSHLLPSFLPR